MPIPTGELLDTAQAAALIGCHPISMVVWRRENRGPPWLSAPDARVVLYRKQDILDWLTRHVPPAETEGVRAAKKSRGAAK